MHEKCETIHLVGPSVRPYAAQVTQQKNKIKMTQFDLPATEDTDSINSSLLSQSSSSANSSGSNRSLSSRSSFGFANIGALHANQSVERGHVPAAVIPSPIHQEFGTLDAILVTQARANIVYTRLFSTILTTALVFVPCITYSPIFASHLFYRTASEWITRDACYVAPHHSEEHPNPNALKP